MRVEFQVLQTNSLTIALDAVSEYVASEYNHTQKLAILAPVSIAKKLDNKLWQDGKESFVPHFCATDAKDYSFFKNIPILITDNIYIISDFDKLINLIDTPIDFHKTSISSLVEFVYQDKKVLENLRKKYVCYKKLGLDIKTIIN